MLNKCYHILSCSFFKAQKQQLFTADHQPGACPDFREERFASQLLTGEHLQALLGHFLDGNQTLSEKTWRGLR